MQLDKSAVNQAWTACQKQKQSYWLRLMHGFKRTDFSLRAGAS